jgi:RNA polymerase sigma factor (sigma-70 family)
VNLFNKSSADVFWYNLNLKWVYTELLSGINAQTKNFHLANDLLHDAIVKFAVRSHTETMLEPHAYLRAITKNLIVDHYRDAAHYVDVEHTPTSDGANIEASIDLEACWIQSPEKLADIKQRMQVLQNIIECLPKKCREVFWLYRIEGKKQTEIATILNISVNMVERHMMRALVDLTFAKDYLIQA